MTNKLGVPLHLLTACPKAIIQSFKADIVGTIAHRDVVKLHMKNNTAETRSLVEHGIFYQPLVALYNSSCSIDASTPHHVITSGIFTNTDLVDMGYDIDPVGIECQAALDTVYHRCFSCPRIETRAKLALGADLFDAVIEAGPNSLFANRCLAPSSSMSEAPADQVIFQTVQFSAGEIFSPESGKVYGDGSCFYPSFQPLSRAGFGIVQVNPTGSS